MDRKAYVARVIALLDEPLEAVVESENVQDMKDYCDTLLQLTNAIAHRYNAVNGELHDRGASDLSALTVYNRD